MTTRKMLIKNKYNEFHSFLKENDFNNELTLFPSLDEIDIADLTYLLTMTFLGITTDDDFKRKISELAEISDVKLTDDKLNILTGLMTKFMLWMREL